MPMYIWLKTARRERKVNSLCECSEGSFLTETESFRRRSWMSFQFRPDAPSAAPSTWIRAFLISKGGWSIVTVFLLYFCSYNMRTSNLRFYLLSPGPRASTAGRYYNPAIEAGHIDRSKISIRQMQASKRSENQAYFIVQQWLQRAMSKDEGPSKRRRT